MHMYERGAHLFIDFEFTMPEGKNNPFGFYPEIIEVGLILVKEDEIIDQYTSYVKPEAFPRLTSRCKKFLNITDEHVSRGISFEELVVLLKKVNSEKPAIVTWGNNDMKVLSQNCRNRGFKMPLTGKQIDLSNEYKRFFGDKNQTGLWKAVQQYGNSGNGKQHRALDDAINTYHIFRLVEQDKRYLDNHESTTIGDIIDFSTLLNELK